jgi:hypothetical protein
VVAHLCNKTFGIGGDDVSFIKKWSESDFKMVYYNSDGSQKHYVETEEDVWWLSLRLKDDWNSARLTL